MDVGDIGNILKDWIPGPRESVVVWMKTIVAPPTTHAMTTQAIRGDLPIQILEIAHRNVLMAVSGAIIAYYQDPEKQNAIPLLEYLDNEFRIARRNIVEEYWRQTPDRRIRCGKHRLRVK